MNDKKFQVIFSTDGNGFPYMYIAVASLIRAQKKRSYRINVLFDGLDQVQKQKLQSLIDGFPLAELRLIDVREFLAPYLELLRKNSGYWPYMTWARCFIDVLFPEVNENVLYLDTDVFVVDDISELLSLDLGENLFAAVPEFNFRSAEEKYKKIGLDSSVPFYFNAGVIVFNMPAYRSAGGSNRVIEIIQQRTSSFVAPDQDVLNLMANGKVHALHPRWNCNDGNLDKQFSFTLREDGEFRGNPTKKVLEAVISPGILHFQGKNKPWRQNHRPERRRYLKLMREFGFAGVFLPGANPLKLTTMAFFDLYHCFLKWLARLRLAVGF